MDIGTGTVRHLDVLRRPLLHSIHPAPGGHCGGQVSAASQPAVFLCDGWQFGPPSVADIGR